MQSTLADNGVVGCSNPSGRIRTTHDVVAQQAEHCPVKAAVAGANPVGIAFTNPKPKRIRPPASNRAIGGSSPPGLAFMNPVPAWGPTQVRGVHGLRCSSEEEQRPHKPDGRGFESHHRDFEKDGVTRHAGADGSAAWPRQCPPRAPRHVAQQGQHGLWRVSSDVRDDEA